MTKRVVAGFALCFLVLVVFCLYLYRDQLIAKKEEEPYEISVICPDQSTENWTTVKLGIDQAAQDLNVNVSFITLTTRNNVKEQVTLLSREVNNGADAVVIAPINSTALREPVEQAFGKIPVVAMQSTVAGLPKLQSVSCDNYKMGNSLAREIVRNEKGGKPVVIFRNSVGSSNIADSLHGVEDALKGWNGSVLYRDIPDSAPEAYSAARTAVTEHRDGVFIALDGATLEAAAKAKKDLMKSGAGSARIYGVGRTNTVVSLLEQKIISAIAVDNEFNIGYLSIKTAVDSINKKADGNTNVNFIIVNSTNMYESESERMLFPFVR
jgi:ribose transport system substrate-binding protein